ncbi:hypothetical protein I4U23_015316 [Adineta vaga]|nr:hypothetical protein I4U23_015316 [Adineta vaga]
MIPEYLCADLYTSRLTILLPHLEKLIIRSFKTEKLQLFIDCIDNCPNLTTLDIQCLTGNSTDICLKKIFAANQGRLTKISFDFESIYLDVSEDTSPRTFPNIKELTINLTAIRALSNLLKLIPNNIFDDVSTLLYLVHLNIHSAGYLWPFDVLTSLIQKIPSLQQLKLSLCTKDDHDMPTSTNPLIFRLPYLRQLHVDRKCELSTLLQASPNLNQLNISFDCLKLFIDKNPYTIQTGIKRLTVYKWIDNNAELIEDLIQIFTSLHHLEIIMNDSKFR